MTTLEIEIALMEYLNIRQNIVVPNVTGMSNTPIYFEADMLSLNSSNYATGFEIKISKADLKNDLKKTHIRNLDKPNYKAYLKTFYNGLKYFNYIVPKELKGDALKQIPEYFGLLICNYNFPYDPSSNRTYIDEVRKPKRLFNYKWSANERYQLARLGSMRIFNYKKKILRLQKYQVIAKVKYELSKDEGIVSVICDNKESDKSIISRAQKIFRSRTNIIHYGNQKWYVVSREIQIKSSK